MKNFREELENLLNKYSMENGSDTPDFMLTGYLIACLENLDKIISAREKWYGRKKCNNFKDERLPHVYSPPKACKPDKTPEELAVGFMVDAARINANNIYIGATLGDLPKVTAEQLLEESDLSYKDYKAVKDLLTKKPECRISANDIKIHGSSDTVIFAGKKYRLVPAGVDWEITVIYPGTLFNCPIGHKGKNLPENHKILQITTISQTSAYKATQNYTIGDWIQGGVIESFRLTNGYPQAVLLGTGKLVDIDDFRKM